MGYTHYWTYTLDEPFKEELVEQVNEVIQDYESILEKLVLKELGGHKTPIATNNLIWFNGIDEQGHEAFVLQSTAGKWSFCKTARKSYDVPVCIVLLLFRYHYPDSFELASDGDIDSPGWLLAAEYIRRHYGYKTSRRDDKYMFDVIGDSYTVHVLGAKAAA